MTQHPAAYLHASPAAGRASAHLGWPPPSIYTDTPADLASGLAGAAPSRSLRLRPLPAPSR
jgi:hypothetical protein